MLRGCVTAPERVLRDGKPTDETRYYVTSLRAGARALLQHVSSVPWSGVTQEEQPRRSRG
jgi:hypothetical protein